MKSIYLFHNDLTAHMRLRKDHPDLKAVWYDGMSTIIRGLIDNYKPSTLAVEETIYESVRRVLGPEMAEYPQVQVTSIGLLDSAREARNPFRVCVLPSNDTHVFLFNPVIEHLSHASVRVLAEKGEAAEHSLKQLGVPFSELDLSEGAIQPFDILISANDWGPLELNVHKAFQKIGKPTACLQESVIRFNDVVHRMEWANFPLLQGLHFLDLLPRDVVFLTGNPRYEALSPSELPAQERVLINSNFTYGIFESIRAAWIEDAVNACKSASVDYLIAQHPRDRGELNDYNVVPSSAAVIHQLIRGSSVLISRFSSLIHEALALGRPVVYFNPHGEQMDSSLAPDGEHIFLARDKKELREALSRLAIRSSETPTEDDFYKNYTLKHFGTGDGRASLRVAQALEMIAGVKEVPPGRAISPVRHKYRLAKLRVRTAIANCRMRTV
jgi:hypothetical protein